MSIDVTSPQRAQPISARINHSPSSLCKAINAAETTPSIRTIRALASLAHWRGPRQPSTLSNQSLSIPFPLDRLAPGDDNEERSVQISVLVAMPSPSPKFKSSYDLDEDEPLPEIMVGVAQVPYHTGSSVSASKLEEITA